MSFIRQRYHYIWWATAFIFILSLVALALFGGHLLRGIWAGAHPEWQEYHERKIPNTDLNPYGANFFLGREVEPWKIDRTLHMAAEAGIGWVKQQFPWEQIEPQRKGEFLDPQTKEDSWAKWDRIVEACERYGLQIVARLDRPPDWTRQDNSYRQSPPDDFEDYGDFVFAFVSRYKGRIRHIQVWNEPNIFPEWGNRPVDPAAYIELLRVAYRRAKEADPDVLVLSAPLAITLGEPHPEPGKWRSMNDLDYLTGMYEAGFAECYDIYSANAFGLDSPPDSPPDSAALNFQRVLLHREIMEHYGDGHKAVWFNEYGWNAAPESMPTEQLVWGRVSEREQAVYTVEGIRMARDEWPWAGVFMIWYFRQVGNLTPGHAEYYFRMVDTDFTPRLVYLAVRDAAQAQGAAGLGLYQESHPAIQAYGQWRHHLSAEASGGAWLRTERPGDSVAFTFRGQEVHLLTQTGPEGGRLLVLLDGQAVGGHATDARGAGYVSLYTPETQNGARIPLVRNAGPGEHTLRLVLASENDEDSLGHIAIVDGFQVLAGDDQPTPLGPLLGVAAGLVLISWLLWRVWRRLRWSLPGAWHQS